MKAKNGGAAFHNIKKLFLLPLLLVTGLFFANPQPALAMHLTEGVLPANWAGLWYALAAVFMLLAFRAIRKRTGTDRRALPLLGLVGAAIFLISVLPVPVPIAGTSSHPAGTPLAAILVGPLISSGLGAIALLIQALLLAHGGLSTWGANIMSMAVVGSFVAFGTFFLLRRLNVAIVVAAFAAGVLGDWATYAVTSFELASALHGSGSLWQMWGTTALAFAPTQLPLGIIEGVFTGGVVLFIQQRRPELLSGVTFWRRKAATTANGGL